MEMARALDERHIAAGLATNLYRPKWYLWQRANAVRFKAAASNALPYYAARWLATNNDFTAYCASISATNVPRMTHANVIAQLGLPTNFWTFTPWVAGDRSSNGLAGIKLVVDLMTWSVTDMGGTVEYHQAINRWSGGPSTYEYLYGDEYNDTSSWANAVAHLDASWALMQVSVYDGNDPQPIAYNCETGTVGSAALGPSCWSLGLWVAGGGYTNYRAQAEAYTRWPSYAAVTNWERAGDFYHTAAAVGTFDAHGHGVSTTATLLVTMPATNAATVASPSPVGPSAGFAKTQPTWCSEPTDGANTARGYSTHAKQWVLRWDATTNGFKFK